MSQTNDGNSLCVPTVKVGEQVLVGLMIGAPTDDSTAPIHSSVSGKVIAIEPRTHPSGKQVQAVIVENNDYDTPAPAVSAGRNFSMLSLDEIVEIVRKSGIIDSSGNNSPTHLKLAPKEGEPIDSIIINATECEPYITCDHRAILEKPYELINGLKVLTQIFGAKQAIIAIGENKPDALNLLRQLIKREKLDVKFVTVKPKYPQGSDKQIVKTILKRKVPAGGTPADIGAAVFSVATCCQIYRSIIVGTPPTDRVVTVAGDCLENPINIRVRIGTPISHIIKSLGGFKFDPEKVIIGDSMTGFNVQDLDIPITKSTNGIIALGNVKILPEQPCIRCGTCVRTCPMKLIPAELDIQARSGNFDTLQKLNINDCAECGACAYACPSRRNIVESINSAKRGERLG